MNTKPNTQSKVQNSADKTETKAKSKSSLIRENLSEILRLFKYLKRYKINWFFSLVFMLLLAGVSSAFPIGVKYFSDLLLESDTIAFDQYLFMALVFLLAYSLRIASNFIQNYSNHLFCQKVSRDIRHDFFAKLIKLPVKFFNRRSVGEILSRFNNDIASIEAALFSSSVAPFHAVPSFLILTGYMFYLNWQLFLVTFTLNIPVFFVIFTIGRKVKRMTRIRQNSVAALSVLATESTTHIRVLKSFDMLDHEQDKFKHKNYKAYRDITKNQVIKAASNSVVEFLAVFYFFSIILYGAILVGQGELSKSDLIAFFAAFFMLIPTLKSFDTFNTRLQESLVSLKRIYSILDRPSEEPDELTKKPDLPPLKKEILIDVKNFAYDDKIILKNLKIKIKKGQVVAIVGHSGAGKTSITNLLTRFFDLSKNQGKITFDGKDIRDYSLKSLRKSIGIVSQESVVFNDSVMYNIAYGKKDSAYEDIIQASKMALSHKFIEDFEFGYNQPVGEGGIAVSGGQRQRISIARTILKGAPILILDEATNSLDAHSEKKVNKALANLMKGKTVIIIAHKLSNIKSVDNIFVLKEGSVLEEGNFYSLMQKEGEFAKLYSSQDSKQT